MERWNLRIHSDWVLLSYGADLGGVGIGWVMNDEAWEKAVQALYWLARLGNPAPAESDAT